MKTIDAIWAWVAIDPTLGQDCEKLICVVERAGQGTRTLPLVYASRANAERARSDAQRFADEQNVTVRLRKFTGRGTCASLKPMPRPVPAKRPRKRRNGRCACCERGDEYNGFGSDGPLRFVCPKGCSCHD